MDETSISQDFPLADLLPKRETEAHAFLNLHPEFDGRGVVIAILDTGVDPLARGLKVTSEGEQKVIECLDTSGSGDVDTSTKVTPDDDGFITGLTGRKLRIPETWTNSSKTYGVGVKAIFDLYHAQTKKRLVDKRKKSSWDEIHATSLAKLRSRISTIETQSSSEKTKIKEDKDDTSKTSEGMERPMEKCDKQEKDDLGHQLKSLEGMEKKFPDSGPVADIVTWNDGSEEDGVSGWCVCVDTSFKGDLASCQVLRPFCEKYDVGRFSEEDLANYSVCVYCKGDVTVLVTTGSSHGTHVAAIAAACVPEAPEMNGIAPGAQIVSIKIGDSRLKTMETGTAMTRAIDYCNRNEIDIINYSFGEPASWHQSGRIVAAIHNSVHQHNVCFVSSAGNNGPALRTVGAPGGTVDGVIGVAAYVSPAMKKAQYAIDGAAGTTHYQWSSRGPCPDGFLGVSISAPGGAITSVPNTTLKGEQLMNGTSMSSPNAAGGMALIVSGLKAKGACYSPFSLNRAIRATAAKMPNHCHFSSGPGNLQVYKAFQHSLKHSSHALNSICIKAFRTKQCDRGVMIHKECEFRRPFRAYINLDLSFPKDSPNDRKVDLKIKVSLVATQPWVSVPSFLYLTNSSSGFWATIDSSGLQPGAHFAEIQGYDSENVEYGPLFSFPVTALRPEKNAQQHKFENVSLNSGQVVRRFLRPPSGASYATIRVQSLNKTSQSRLSIHCLQIKDATGYNALEFKRPSVIVEDDAVRTFDLKVVPHEILELAVAQPVSWAHETIVNYEISFHGVDPPGNQYAMSHFESPLRIDVQSRLDHTTVSPVATLRQMLIPLRPSDHRISPLSAERGDVFLQDNEVIYALELTYNYTHTMKEKEIVPQCPLLSDQLYESLVDSQMWMLFDSQKQVIAIGDAFPSSYACQVEKGEYTFKFWIRSPNTDDLEKLKSLPFVVAVKLPSPLTVDVFTRPVSLKKFQFTSTLVTPGDSVTMFLMPLSEEKLPKNAPTNATLSGTLTFVAEESAKKVDTYPLSYILGPAVNGKKQEKDKSSSKEKTFAESIRDAKVSYMQKKNDFPEEDAEKLFGELVHEFPDEIPIYLAYLSYIGAKSGRAASMREKTVEICNNALSRLPLDEILVYFGCKLEGRDDSVDVKEMDRKRSQAVDLLQRKGCALLELESVSDEDVDQCWKKLRQFADTSDSKTNQFSLKYYRHKQLLGFLLWKLLQEYEESSNKSVLSSIAEVCGELGWVHISQRLTESTLLVRYPSSYPLF